MPVRKRFKLNRRALNLSTPENQAEVQELLDKGYLELTDEPLPDETTVNEWMEEHYGK